MTTTNQCHCGQPAPWLLRVVEVHDGGILDELSLDAWATCDVHIAEASQQLHDRNAVLSDGRAVLLLRLDT